MFGYVLPHKAEMKIKEYELFRAYYCGVCKAIGKRCGQIPRLALNYDSTFLAVLLSALSAEAPSLRREACIAHPLNKRHVVKKNKVVDYASDINILLAYYNLKDNWEDERSVLSGAATVLLKRAFGKLRKKYADKCAVIEQRLHELAVLEKEKCASMDHAAEPFAKLMEEIMIYPPLCSNEDAKKVLGWIGYNLGKWIYILDAYDDIEKDIKEKAYNPLVCQFGYSGGSVCDFRNEIKERVEFNLTHTLSQISKAFELLQVRHNSGILENIIYMGMLKKTEHILETGGCSKVEKSV